MEGFFGVALMLVVRRRRCRFRQVSFRVLVLTLLRVDDGDGGGSGGSDGRGSNSDCVSQSGVVEIAGLGGVERYGKERGWD